MLDCNGKRAKLLHLGLLKGARKKGTKRKTFSRYHMQIKLSTLVSQKFL